MMMDFLANMLFKPTAVQAVIVLSLAIFTGLAIGRIRVGSVRFGVGGVLFSGIILGHLGMGIDGHILHYAREFGLVLFVYGVGMGVGPAFLDSFRSSGAKLCLLALLMVLGGVTMAFVCFRVFGLSADVAVGLFCGSVTNTPALSAAIQIFGEIMTPDMAAASAKNTAIGYAVAYPFSIFCVIMTMVAVRAILKADLSKEAHVGKGQGPHVADSATALADARALLAAKAPGGADGCEQRTLVVSNHAVVRKCVRELGLAPEQGICLVRIMRGGEEIVPTGGTRLFFADKVLAVATPEGMGRLAATLGDNAHDVEHPQVASLFFGLFVGLVLGGIPIFVPGLSVPLKAGYAGGVLIMAIVLSLRHRFCGMTFHMTPSALMMVREIGIGLFLACVGVNAGAEFFGMLFSAQGLLWIVISMLIALVPLALVAFVGHVLFKVRYGILCGVLAGSMTDPPALAFANQMLGGNAAALGFSMVYPLTMLMRIMAGQLLALAFVAF